MGKSTDLLDICFPSVLTQEILNECHRFTCGDDDMDEFFYNDAPDYTRFRMEKALGTRLMYCDLLAD